MKEKYLVFSENIGWHSKQNKKSTRKGKKWPISNKDEYVSKLEVPQQSIKNN